MMNKLIVNTTTSMVLAFLIFGCSSKNENEMKKSFHNHIKKHTALQKSEKIKLIQNKEVKIALTATYLNAEKSLNDKEEKTKEAFILGLYKSDDITAIGFNSNEQNLTLNVQYPKTDKILTKDEEHQRRKGYDAVPLISKELSYNDPLLSKIPLVNSWTQYYFVEFPYSHRKNFSLVFQNKQLGSQKYQLNFAKNAKYLYFTTEEKEQYLLLK